MRATATTTGAWRSTRRRTSRSRGWERGTTTAPTSSSAPRARTSASPTACRCRRWRSSESWGCSGCLLFLGAVLAGFARRARAARTNATDLGLAVAGGGMFLVWLVHTSVDWLHLIPGVTGIALCGAAVLVAPWARPGGAAGRSPRRIATIAVCALLVLVGATLVGRAALADKYRSDSKESRGLRSRRRRWTRPRTRSPSTTSRCPPTTPRPPPTPGWTTTSGLEAALIEATRREPHDFVPWALLGDLATRRGEERQAQRYYRQALRLNPRNAGLRETERGVGGPKTATSTGLDPFRHHAHRATRCHGPDMRALPAHSRGGAGASQARSRTARRGWSTSFRWTRRATTRRVSAAGAAEPSPPRRCSGSGITEGAEESPRAAAPGEDARPDTDGAED